MQVTLTDLSTSVTSVRRYEGPRKLGGVWKPTTFWNFSNWSTDNRKHRDQQQDELQQHQQQQGQEKQELQRRRQYQAEQNKNQEQQQDQEPTIKEQRQLCGNNNHHSQQQQQPLQQHRQQQEQQQDNYNHNKELNEEQHLEQDRRCQLHSNNNRYSLQQQPIQQQQTHHSRQQYQQLHEQHNRNNDHQQLQQEPQQQQQRQKLQQQRSHQQQYENQQHYQQQSNPVQHVQQHEYCKAEVNQQQPELREQSDQRQHSNHQSSEETDQLNKTAKQNLVYIQTGMNSSYNLIPTHIKPDLEIQTRETGIRRRNSTGSDLTEREDKLRYLGVDVLTDYDVQSRRHRRHSQSSPIHDSARQHSKSISRGMERPFSNSDHGHEGSQNESDYSSERLNISERLRTPPVHEHKRIRSPSVDKHQRSHSPSVDKHQKPRSLGRVRGKPRSSSNPSSEGQNSSTNHHDAGQLHNSTVRRHKRTSSPPVLDTRDLIGGTNVTTSETKGRRIEGNGLGGCEPSGASGNYGHHTSAYHHVAGLPEHSGKNWPHIHGSMYLDDPDCLDPNQMDAILDEYLREEEYQRTERNRRGSNLGCSVELPDLARYPETDSNNWKYYHGPHLLGDCPIHHNNLQSYQQQKQQQLQQLQQQQRQHSPSDDTFCRHIRQQTKSNHSSKLRQRPKLTDPSTRFACQQAADECQLLRASNESNRVAIPAESTSDASEISFFPQNTFKSPLHRHRQEKQTNLQSFVMDMVQHNAIQTSLISLPPSLLSASPRRRPDRHGQESNSVVKRRSGGRFRPGGSPRPLGTAPLTEEVASVSSSREDLEQGTGCRAASLDGRSGVKSQLVELRNPPSLFVAGGTGTGRRDGVRKRTAASTTLKEQQCEQQQQQQQPQQQMQQQKSPKAAGQIQVGAQSPNTVKLSLNLTSFIGPSRHNPLDGSKGGRIGAPGPSSSASSGTPPSSRGGSGPSTSSGSRDASVTSLRSTEDVTVGGLLPTLLMTSQIKSSVAQRAANKDKDCFQNGNNHNASFRNTDENGGLQNGLQYRSLNRGDQSGGLNDDVIQNEIMKNGKQYGYGNDIKDRVKFYAADVREQRKFRRTLNDDADNVMPTTETYPVDRTKSRKEREEAYEWERKGEREDGRECERGTVRFTLADSDDVSLRNDEMTPKTRTNRHVITVVCPPFCDVVDS